MKEKLDIVDEIGAVVTLKKSGKSFKGLCPFHGERTPSFYVLPERRAWHCYGCHEGGDIFTFVQKQQGLDFREALVLLAERASITLDDARRSGGEPGQESADTTARKRLRDLNEAAAIWLHHQLLQAPEAQYARSYLASRGVNGDSIALWRLGYAPEGGFLAAYLQAQGYGARELVDAGLVREREADRGGGLYDYFRNRLIFPIRDIRGRTIAFGGRELGGGTPKYLNTPQTLLFDKSATLYGLDLARDGIRRSDRVIVVEGYMDALITHQYGTSRNVVACIGSAITEKHIRQIKKLTRRVTLALDPDTAGEHATLRGITVAQQAFDRVTVLVPGPAPEAPSAERRRLGARTHRSEPQGMVRFEEQVDAEITVARLPEHEDPDEFIRRDLAGWQRAIAEATPLIDYLVEAQTAGLALDTPQGKLEACRRLLPIIAEVRDRTLADEYVGRLAQKVRLDKIDLRRDLLRTRQRLDQEVRSAPKRIVEEPASDADDDESVEPPGGKYQGSQQVGSTAGYSAAGAAYRAAPGGSAGELFAEQALSEYCLGMVLECPQTWAEMHAIVGAGDFTDTRMRALYEQLAQVMGDGATPERYEAIAFLTALPPELRDLAEMARARVAPDVADEEVAVARIGSHVAYRLKRMRLKAEMAELDALIGEAERELDSDARRTLLMRKQQLLSERRAIDAVAL